jgi:dTDP-glucose 4,6-dehydratase/UDP-glucose 4-epimerase
MLILNNWFSRKRVLVTGGFGFIGSNLVRSLVSQGATVTIIDNLDPLFGGNLFNLSDLRGNVDVHIGDVRDRKKMQELIDGQDILYHLAAQTSHVGSMDDPLLDMEINAMAHLQLLEICRDINRDIKIVFTSTRQIYGQPDVLPVTEEHALRPPDVNGINKMAAEMSLQLYYKYHGIRSCILRLTNTYGPRMRVKDARQTFLGIWIRRLLTKQPIEIYGDGTQLRDFNYIDDCVSALLIAASDSKSDGGIFNLGSDEIVSLIDLAKALISFGVEGAYDIVPFPEERKNIDIGSCYSDFSLFRKKTGWQPAVCLREGLEETVRFYQLHSDQYWV